MTIEELQEQLLKQIAGLEDQRKKNAADFEKERKDILEFAAMERAKKDAAYNKKLEEHKAKQALKDAEEQEKARRSLADKNALEQKQFEVEETLRKQKEKLAWLEQQIANAEFTEEQFRKAKEAQKRALTNPVELPEDGSQPGESSVGTDGSVQSEQMSDHLKRILRLAPPPIEQTEQIKNCLLRTLRQS